MMIELNLMAFSCFWDRGRLASAHAAITPVSYTAWCTHFGLSKIARNARNLPRESFYRYYQRILLYERPLARGSVAPSQAKACATVLPNPTAPNVETADAAAQSAEARRWLKPPLS
jgi:hypothetical protein